MLNQRIERILSNHEATRSDDRLLILAVWKSYGFYLSETQEQIFMDLPSSESIRRTRQSLQQHGLYPANDRVRTRRKFKGWSVRQRMPRTRPEKVDNLINERLI